ncbi:WD40-repeat-containing domain protein [Yarrowia lipolytica]|uniref:YALI0E19404p n=2 Tax=Yarrowia lipolytica TaxID=4952 RepID=Q6C5B8_YARLI|nr:YALI0E19404p [Yarrowia lipolytica CLIB122]RDW23665.1 WD40-repeat-containing domain protein [Yarrowia lipolytica]RDW30574.1 WD40-repeat-containing domain protein [Yarrowia lipolytica]RDW37288.1 WD40-repeat-containing domain protein [Yarrowia lipolytica]RDW43538.1 WD40-repeat-containing domain protein [Yarrowia lipolytica]RDW50372.1 WD40-repeat-containing domain protein [Yarrowia lipolytica]|eukprot:XP_504144.1 YALI0E19404p [Yarrowia lipolytica CLIB122]
MNVSAAKELQLSGKEYVLAIVPVPARKAVAAALSDNSIHLVSLDLSHSTKIVDKSHERIVGMKNFDESTVMTWGNDGVKLWDLREQNSDSNKPLLWMKQGTLGPIVSCDFRDNIVVGGSELVGTDAGICLWDVTKPKADGMPFIEFPDVHNDDVTELRFHPTRENIVVSGSTDGLVNVYDIKETDQDEVVKQVFNHDSSIHFAGFTSANRVYVISHMETLSIYEMDFEKDDYVSREPLEFGDVRQKFGCEYVADIVPGYVISGSNNADTYAPGQVQLLPFRNETVTHENEAAGVVTLNEAHGTEVVRTVYLDAANDAVYTGGEDGYIRLWNVPDLQLGFGDFMTNEDTEMGGSDEGWQEVTPKKDKKDKKDMKDKKDKKDKKEDKDKKEKREKREKKEKRKKEKEEADKKDKKKKEKKDKKDKKDKKEERFAPY